jgi:hypothetical protein
MAVGAASSEEASHDHTLRLHTRPACTMCALRGANLTSNMAKLGLQVGRPVGVSSAAGAQDRDAARGEEGEGGHGAGRVGREGGEG